MGRIKRKKPISKKKTSKSVAEKTVSPPAKDIVEQTQGGLKTDTPKASKIGKTLSLKKTTGVVKAAPKKSESNIIDKSLQFLREVKIELKKVTWPSRKQTIGSTVVVIILVMIISLFLGVVDLGLSSLIRVVLQ